MFAIWIDFATPEYDQVLALRYEVLRKPLNLEFSVADLQLEYKNLHLAIYDNQFQLLATAMLVLAPDETVEMRQVAVLPDAQGKGVGRYLVHAFEKKALQLGFHQIRLAARDTAIPFYSKLGYLPIGKTYKKLNISHQDMQKNLSTPQNQTIA